jgi:hypothetical protein
MLFLMNFGLKFRICLWVDFNFMNFGDFKNFRVYIIKSVLQAIPSYIMSVYIISETLIKDIERMLNSFWWGRGTHNRGIGTIIPLLLMIGSTTIFTF